MSESWKDSRFQCEQLPTCYVKETGSCHFHSYWFLVKPHTVGSSVYKLNDETIAGQESNSTTCRLTLLPLHSTIINFVKIFCLFLQFCFKSLKYSRDESSRMSQRQHLKRITLLFVERNSWSLVRDQINYYAQKPDNTNPSGINFSVVIFWLIPHCCSPFSPIHQEPTVNLISDLFVLCFSRGLTLLT